MSEEYKEMPRSKVTIRGKMLVAWFAEATPPVLWRWKAGDLTSGFTIRQTDGKADLIRHDGGPMAQTIATFPSTESAEQAVARVSRALLALQSPWRRAAKIAAALFLIVALVAGSLVGFSYSQYRSREALIAKLGGPDGLKALLDKKKALVSGTAGPQILPGQVPANAKPLTPPVNTPVDVDSFYH